MGKGEAVLAFLAVTAVLGLIALAVDERSKIDCQQCKHRHKPNADHIWKIPS